MIYELEVNGEVIKRGSYGVVMEHNAIEYGGRGQIFTYRASKMRKMETYLNEEDAIEIAAMRNDGMAWDEIAYHFGYSSGHLREHAKKYSGIELRKRSNIPAIMDMLNKGMTVKEISQFLDISKSTVWMAPKRKAAQLIDR